MGVIFLLFLGKYVPRARCRHRRGFIALFGIALLIRVVLVTYFNQLIWGGLPIDEALSPGDRGKNLAGPASGNHLPVIPLFGTIRARFAEPLSPTTVSLDYP
jgi:hypothetical protein